MSFQELKVLIKLAKFLVKTNKTIKLDNFEKPCIYCIEN